MNALKQVISGISFQIFLVSTLCCCPLNAEKYSPEVIACESEKANALFEAIFDERLDRSPVYQSYLGIKKDYDKWDDISEDQVIRELSHTVSDLLRVRTEMNPKALNASTRLSYELFIREYTDAIEAFRFRHHNYPVNQMRGWHEQVPSFLINIHRIDNPGDAEAYISRLNGVGRLFDQVIDNLELRRKKGVVAPRFVFSRILDASRKVIQGRPFDEGDSMSPLLTDFTTKISKLVTLSESQRQTLDENVRSALKGTVKPAYIKLIQYLETLEELAEESDGVWKLPEGDAFYRHKLRQFTTTNLMPQEIHDIGLKEVARIHGEMMGIIRSTEFDGSLQEFFVFMRDNPKFYYPDTDQGRADYLKKAVDIVDHMRLQLDSLFYTKPKAVMIVKAVEPFREKTAGKAFYQRPAPDGSRPGIYYANLYDMKSMPIYQMEALAYHEGIPGHHMQLAISQELTGIPRFRKYGSYTAYVEGWGLYCEMLPKEIGFYSDPYSDFGRLAMEIWRAGRLVVDTGLHYLKWTREEATEYLKKNTPNSELDCRKAIERYIVMPGQATAYKIGMMKILQLRTAARKTMGERFDLRGFHDLILKQGPLPLDTLESEVNRWIADQK